MAAPTTAPPAASPCSPAAWAAPASCRDCCTPAEPPAARDAEVTVVANTADDIWLHGLKVCPDLDTVMYTLGGGIDTERGWGRTDETWRAKEELEAYGVEPTWFGLGDRDLATHLVRTQMLEAGYPLSAVTEALCRAGCRPGVRLLPMTDDRVETHSSSTTPTSRPAAARSTSRSTGCGCTPRSPARTVVPVGIDQSTAGPGVVEAITGADLVVLPPSNPVVSVGTILGVPGSATRSARHAPGGRPLPGRRRQPRARHGRAAAHRDRRRGERRGGGRALRRPRPGGVLDGWLVDTADADDVARVEAAGIACRAVPLMMTDLDATAAMAAATLDLAAAVRR